MMSMMKRVLVMFLDKEEAVLLAAADFHLKIVK
jgi:hypothetical protein